MKYGLILGRSNEVWDELAKAKEMLVGQPLSIIAVKRAGRDYEGPVHHWVAFHHDMLPEWVKERAKHNRPPAENYWSSRNNLQRTPKSPLPIRWLRNIGGSSGLLGVQVGLQPEVGLDKLILCGIPMTASKRYDIDTPWKEALAYRASWKQFYPQMKDRVRSMSGWTQELLGPVTKEWLHAPLPESTDTGGTA